MKKNLMEFGRSMVEMLGVLAVIGVLSIVGLYGYKKAMNKIHANELMNLAMQVYNGGIARSMAISSTDSNDYLFFLQERDWDLQRRSVTQNLGGERPSWTKDRFGIYVKIRPTYEASKTHHELYFCFMDEEDCEALKSLTTWQSEKSYRLLPGSVSDSLPYGVWVYCYKESSGSGTFWKTTDTE